MTKVRCVPGLSPAAFRLLQNLEHSGRHFQDAQEARRIMRFDTQAHRVQYGTPMFVTLFPDKSQSMRMTHCSRTRRKDHIFLCSSQKAIVD